MRQIILVGGGGHCKSVIEAAESAGYTIKGILDLPQFMGNKVLDYAVIGSDEEIPLYVNECDFVVTLGYIKKPLLRDKLHERIEAAGGNLATIVASTAHVSKYATLGAGTVVLHGAMVNAGAAIGKGCIINTLANIEHDAIIGDYCHISTGAMVNGDCRVGENTFLGSRSVMVNNTSIPSSSVFAAGCLVRKTLTIEGLYAGNPAVLIKKA
ncbi:NeuD/PglB/VioB family sugar acetyltransferase [Parabacteroides distasonis]|uniref:NeuD/PglB/VioB family sugar acetyltransferase n=1 Tax=Parabacteroides distasonis TaxID=823 RepID=UPI001D12D136|nr:NeuD/PglB/VioB family sugar acetyltransferase [Parabacteroides distasonis]MCC2781332.1 NeuD/PglB/VioB family sugar acetyltransferase [Parabacteroides distasonis]MCQ5180838.1 NeuD/PglB/VioB family sugar acetyltransferase [Parabacteroides distasonis]